MAQNQIPPSNPWNKHPASNPWNKASASASTPASPSKQPHPVTASLRDIMDEQTNEAKNMGNQRTSQGHPLRNPQWSGMFQAESADTNPVKKFTYTETTPSNRDRTHASSTTTVVNVRVRHLRQLGYKDLVEWTKDPNHVYIGRDMTHYVPGAVGSMWQNPFKDKQMGRDECVRRYKHHIETSEKIQRNGKTLLNSLEELKGKTLGCWCHPERCHGHTLVELIEEYVP